MTSSQKKITFFFLAPMLGMLIFICIVPIIFNFHSSVFDYVIYRPDSRSFVGLGNYIKVVLDNYFYVALKNTALFLLGCLGIQIPLGLALALLLNKENKLTYLVRGLLILPMVTTPVALGLTWRMMLDPTIGVINYLLTLIRLPEINWLGSPQTALLSIIIVDSWQWTPFITLLMLSGLKSLSKDPIEASIVDGASPWQRFIYITFPLLKTIFIIAVILRTIWILRAFDKFYTMTGGGPGITTTILSYYTFENAYLWMKVGYACALAIISLFITIAICTLFIRYMPK